MAFDPVEIVTLYGQGTMTLRTASSRERLRTIQNVRWETEKLTNSTPREPVPIMSEAEQRFMAFEGLLQWTAATIEQGRRIAACPVAEKVRPEERRMIFAQTRTEHHFFAIAAHKVLEHREWVQSLGLCAAVDFSMLDQFAATHVRDLRNMREHVVDYFKGIGLEKDRWRVDTPEFSADASSCVGTMIGGRLDWKLFAQACERLLPLLLSEPIPYPPR